MKKYIIGIISYLPDGDLYAKRKCQVEQNLKKLYSLFPNFPILIIAQNYKENLIYNKNQKIELKYYDKLGIINARYTLQKELLKYDFDYAILLDDDAIIYGTDSLKFIETFEKYDSGFCFRQRDAKITRSVFRYMKAALNFCVISKDILEKEYIDLRFDPEQNIAYEDVVYPSLLYNKYKDKEIMWPIGTIYTSYNYTNKSTSTWLAETNKKLVGSVFIRHVNSIKICDYIDKYKEYPNFNLSETNIITITNSTEESI